MITLNGAKFAETEAEFNDSLFTGPATCVGYAKRLKTKIKLLNPQHELIGVINKWGCLLSALKLEDGKYWYSFTTIKEIGEYEDFAESVNEPTSYL